MSVTDDWQDKVQHFFEDAGFAVRDVAREPNRYWNDGTGLPWLRVHTDEGVVSVGWRKHVIQIDWSAAMGIPADGDELFKGEGVTTGATFVHAWGMEKLAEYVKMLGAERRPVEEARRLRIVQAAGLAESRRGLVEAFRRESEEIDRQERMLLDGCDHVLPSGQAATVALDDPGRSSRCAICQRKVY